jgi:ElaA protein
VHLYDCSFAELSTPTLYALLRLRSDVFVVEQQCAYPELDGRDTEPETRHVWLAPADDPADPHSYLRILIDADGAARIGRVVTAAKARGMGLSSRLMTAALQRIGSRPCVLDAQSYLIGFYTSFGFLESGPEYVEDGIAHVPMRRRVA